MKESPNLESKINFEINQIEKEIKIIEMLKVILLTGTLDDIQLRASASILHSVYNGIEKILLFKIKELNLSMDMNSKWHTELLSLCRKNKIISDKLEIQLREYMGFRHFFRHSYGSILDHNNIKPLILNIETVFNDFKAEMIYSSGT